MKEEALVISIIMNHGTFDGKYVLMKGIKNEPVSALDGLSLVREVA